jgi:hypothetical protein
MHLVGYLYEDVAECSGPVECYAVSIGEKLLTFRIIVLLSSSRSNSAMRHRTAVTIYLSTQRKV